MTPHSNKQIRKSYSTDLKLAVQLEIVPKHILLAIPKASIHRFKNTGKTINKKVLKLKFEQAKRNRVVYNKKANCNVCSF